jgi:hypothetical protein
VSVTTTLVTAAGGIGSAASPATRPSSRRPTGSSTAMSQPASQNRARGWGWPPMVTLDEALDEIAHGLR